MRIDAEIAAGMIGAQEELDRQVKENGLFWDEDDGYFDGHIDLPALVVAIIERSAPIRATTASPA